MATRTLPQAVVDELDAAERILARTEVLARISASKERIDRRYLSDEHKQTNALVAEWMQEVGMATHQDAAGNIIGLAGGQVDKTTLEPPRVVIGSHLDTVPDAGKYDGILGVLAGIEMASTRPDRCVLEVIGFGEEEGVRFGTTLMTSRARAGNWDESWWQLEDADGISLAQAFANFGLSADAVSAALAPADAYVELHIEQGPVLEALDLPVGVVTGIAGARRCAITITGLAGHAGTVPMDMRQDALLGAARCTLLTKELADLCNVTATVGQLKPSPGAVNVIAGGVEMTLDVRSLDNSKIDDYIAEWQLRARQLCTELGLEIGFDVYHSADSVLCDNTIQRSTARALETLNLPVHSLPSGAGHDAMAMHRLCPVGMLFMRCERGLSHHPEESVTVHDVAWGLAALRGTLTNLTRELNEKLDQYAKPY